MHDLEMSPPPSEPPKVVFGVCTFRRPSLAQTLQSLSLQTLMQDTGCSVIVADNDDKPSALSLVEHVRGLHAMRIHYIHAPARNISVARNALLEKARLLGADFLAMIDDDEIADINWGGQLLVKMEALGADAVLGKVTAVYSSDAAVWMRKAQLHDTAPEIQRDGRILNGYTGNVMLRLDSPHLQSRRFDLAMGRTGGEDDVFFRGMVRDGGKIGYAPSAIVYEEVPKEREGIAFLLRRSFRSGQTHGRITEPDREGGRIAIPLAKAAAKATVLLGWAALNVFSADRRTRALMRASLHVGVCSHLLGKDTLELYKS